MTRIAAYPSYHYLVTTQAPRDPERALGGFSDVSGLPADDEISGYRDGNETGSPGERPTPGSHKAGDVTLKRGVVDSADVWAWIEQTRTSELAAQRDVVIALRDEAANVVQSWRLSNTVAQKCTGPALTGKGSGDVALEELALSADRIEMVPRHRED